MNVGAELARKIRWRLVAPTILFMLLSSLDRVNISFAALRMNAELGFTPSQYGFGAGILFAGFLGGQYPSILFLQRFGMRHWMGACALLWGCSAGAIAFIHSHMEFYLLRVLLGFAEGGIAPGIVIYLSQFATERERATTFAMPMLAVPLSIIIGGPISGWLIGIGSPAGLASWRWMILAEAVPTILLGVGAFFYFPNGPKDARWLTPAEKDWLERNAANRENARERNDWTILLQPIVWTSALLWFCLLAGAYGIMFWLPQMVKQMTTLTPFQIGLVNALPWLGAALGTYFNSAHSDRTGERFWHVGLPAALTALFILAGGGAGAGPLGLGLLFLAGLGLGSAQGAFWALPTSLFTPATFAVGAVAINIAGSSGGLIVPHVIGIVRENSGGFAGPTLLIAGLLVAAALLVLMIRLWQFHPAHSAKAGDG